MKGFVLVYAYINFAVRYESNH